MMCYANRLHKACKRLHKKYNLFETFSCFVLDFFLSLQPKIDTN